MQLRITRTVGSISSSQFLQNCGPQINPSESCTRIPAPAHNFIFYNLTVLWLRDSLYRDTAPVPFCNICYIMTVPFHLSALYRDTRNDLQNLYPDGKNHAVPSLHRDSFLAYRDRFVAVLSSGYAYSLNRRAVMCH